MKQHASRFLNLVQDAQTRILEITPQILKEKLDRQEPLYIIDVREESEWPTGHIPTAIHIGKGIIERDIEKRFPDLATPIVVYCSGGFRSALVANNLQKMGYTTIYSLAGGSSAWVAAGYSLA